MSAIRADEWLAALHDLSNRSVDGFTMLELSEATGFSLETTRKKVRALVLAGRAVHAGDRLGTSSSGRGCYTPVYALVKEGK